VETVDLTADAGLGPAEEGDEAAAVKEVEVHQTKLGNAGLAAFETRSVAAQNEEIPPPFMNEPATGESGGDTGTTVGEEDALESVPPLNAFCNDIQMPNPAADGSGNATVGNGNGSYPNQPHEFYPKGPGGYLQHTPDQFGGMPPGMAAQMGYSPHMFPQGYGALVAFLN
jgi:hypothetical protein